MAARTFEDMIEKYPRDVRDIVVAVRKSLRQWLPGVEEEVDATAPLLGYGYGGGYRGTICTLILSKTGVKLGLARGSELADPKRLLAGTGKVHRYVVLESPADLRRAGVKGLVQAAHAAWKERTAG